MSFEVFWQMLNQEIGSSEKYASRIKQKRKRNEYYVLYLGLDILSKSCCQAEVRRLKLPIPLVSTKPWTRIVFVTLQYGLDILDNLQKCTRRIIRITIIIHYSHILQLWLIVQYKSSN